MSDIGRIPLWMVATVGGLAALGLLSLFIFGSYILALDHHYKIVDVIYE